MKLINVIIALLLIGGSVRCKRENESLGINAHSFYLGYEVDLEYFRGNLPDITPIEFKCYFNAVNNTNKPISLNFIYNNNDVVDFNPDKGDYFYAMALNDSATVFLKPLHRLAVIPSGSNQIVPVKFPYRESEKVNSAIKGASLEQIAERVSNIDFFFKRNAHSKSADVIEVDKRDLYVYFMFRDTSITCTQSGCVPYIDPATLYKGKK